MFKDTDKVTPELVKDHGLTEEEYKIILEALGREPNYLELGIFSVMWSEHCSYKSSRIHLKKFKHDSKLVLQGPGENAGIIDLGNGYVLGMKIESHNHPSAIEPYQGAATGVGGILRDVFTMGLRPVAVLNSLRFGDLDKPESRYLFKHVVEGIAGYGNCTGIPTVAGEVYFDDCYSKNCLVNAMAVGIGKKNKIVKGIASGSGNPVIYIGSRTGRDGIHGATFASEDLSSESESKRSSVQIADPFTEKLLIEACLELIDTGVVVGMQDMGAAGLTSSSVEMSSKGGCGIRFNLDNVPVREKNMTGYQIMLSESQERMLVIVQKGKEDIARNILEKWDLEFSVIGEVIEEPRIKINYQGEQVCDIPVRPLVESAPCYDRLIKPPRETASEKPMPDLQGAALEKIIRKIMGSPTVASKDWVFGQYDYWVGTDTCIRPGKDAAVMRIKNTEIGFALTVDGNARYCRVDPYKGGVMTMVEAAANIISSGGKPAAVTDCLNFANPEIPERFYQFVKAVDGIADASKTLDIPVISGNVSLYNESSSGPIDPTPVIGMVGLTGDPEKLPVQQVNPGQDCILLDWGVDPFLAGTQLEKELGHRLKNDIPKLELIKIHSFFKKIISMFNDHDFRYVTDVSEGGVLVSVLESLKEPGLGIKLNIPDVIDPVKFLLGELPGRFIAFTEPDRTEDICTQIKQSGFRYTQLGKTNSTGKLEIKEIIVCKIEEIMLTYKNVISNFMNVTL